MPTHTKPPKQPTVADVPSFEFLTFMHSKEEKLLLLCLFQHNLWNAPLNKSMLLRTSCPVFSHGILYRTLHHFPCMPRHALKNVGCLVVYMILVEFLKASPPDITNSQISTHCHRFVLQFEHYIDMNIHTGIMAHLN